MLEKCFICFFFVKKRRTIRKKGKICILNSVLKHNKKLCGTIFYSIFIILSFFTIGYVSGTPV